MYPPWRLAGHAMCGRDGRVPFNLVDFFVWNSRTGFERRSGSVCQKRSEPGGLMKTRLFIAIYLGALLATLCVEGVGEAGGE